MCLLRSTGSHAGIRISDYQDARLTDQIVLAERMTEGIQRKSLPWGMQSTVVPPWISGGSGGHSRLAQ